MKICQRSFAVMVLLGLDVSISNAQAVLELESKIPLGQVSGRIDHLAVDADRRRLFVAELGNDSVGVVDLDRHEVRRIKGLNEPQGVAYLPKLDKLVVTNAHDGSVRFFEGPDLAAAGRFDLKDDADNIRVLPDGKTIVVGYGSGALAFIDAAERRQLADIRLKGHPEGFQIDLQRPRIFVNVPGAQEIAVVDSHLGRQIGQWATSDMRANFPMALLGARAEVAVIFRKPARLVTFRTADGGISSNKEICGDADDVFHDARRDRVYVSCGDGAVEILARETTGFRRLAIVPTVSGARTSLFVPDLDRLFVAVRTRGAEPAAIWVFRPV